MQTDKKTPAVMVDGEVQTVGAVDVSELNAIDVAGRFLAEIATRPNAEQLLAPFTPEEERAVTRKADLIIVPLLLIALMMGAVDKNALGTAAILNLRTDLNLVGQEYSWAGSLIFFGQLASLFPALMMMQRFPAGKVIASMVILWGIISMCIASCSDFAGLAICRFILGVFESLTFPGFSLIISSWWTRKEQVVRTAIIYSTLSSFTNGILSYASSFVTPSMGVRAWQLLFLLVGAVTFVWGTILFAFLPDSPVSAKWLTERQRVVAVLRLKANRTGIENKHFKMYQLWEALRDVKTWTIFFINICLNVPNGGISTFNSIIVNGLGYGVRETMLLQIPTGLISWVSSLVFSFIAIKTQQRVLTALCACLIPLLSTILLYVIPRTNQAGSLGALFVIYFYWAPYIVLMTVVMSNSGGYTKKAVVYGIAYAGYLVGNIIGPQTFRAEQAPAYVGGFVAMLVCYCVAILLIFLYYVNILRLNRQKSLWREKNPQSSSSDVIDDWRDETDFENRDFKYIL